ncbi:phosphotransferase [Arachidicoccus ginsenosidivorans]|uniref:Phosphotransferase n=1 Tax=Arachidicoccus ginsenosidivorans TaxID=496057 RepID=A0A5B8VRU0_9BACT|nr:aminoglycoside phosphotransferase family protein [Arachidicoccus ginsenosidivorans]QEC73993.1 phosphotransferase [Arachidicoccus ginsenosidivorans]
MEQYDLLVIQGVPYPKPLVAYLASGEVLWEPLALLMTGIGRLHSIRAKEVFINNELYENTSFRDFKLQLQYYDLAAGMEASSALKSSIIDLADRYKTQKYTLLHGDLNSRNVIINSKDNSFGVIDFEQSHVGNPIYDLAYILSEVYMACLYHGIDMDATMHRLIQAYTKSNTTFDLKNHWVEFKKHLGVQILYRLHGPSKASWSFYMTDMKKRAHIIEVAKLMIMQRMQFGEWS